MHGRGTAAGAHPRRREQQRDAAAEGPLRALGLAWAGRHRCSPRASTRTNMAPLLGSVQLCIPAAPALQMAGRQRGVATAAARHPWCRHAQPAAGGRLLIVRPRRRRARRVEPQPLPLSGAAGSPRSALVVVLHSSLRGPVPLLARRKALQGHGRRVAGAADAAGAGRRQDRRARQVRAHGGASGLAGAPWPGVRCRGTAPRPAARTNLLLPACVLWCAGR